MNKIPLLFSILCFIIYRILFYSTGSIWLSLLIFLLPIGFLIFNFIVRNRLSFSPWFLSPRNFFLARTTHNSESELDSELLYAKLLEVIEDSDFKLLDTYEAKFQILLGTSVNFWTWGENIYIQVVPAPDGSVIQFTSVTLYGTTSWKRNDNNFQAFIQSFEESLTI